jgi:hypothetical protein
MTRRYIATFWRIPPELKRKKHQRKSLETETKRDKVLVRLVSANALNLRMKTIRNEF